MNKLFVLEKNYCHGNKTMSDKKEKEKKNRKCVKAFSASISQL